MHLIKGWEETPTFDPTNPNQRIRETYAAFRGDGGYISTYFNPVDTGAQLQGYQGASLMGWESIPSFAQVGIVLAVSAIAGYFGWKKWGESSIRPTLKKVPIVGGLMGPSRRRRRR